MVDEALELRRRGLEESFFAKHNHELVERLRRKRHEEQLRRELVEISGVRDEAVLDELVSLDVGASALAALGLVPLVLVAWADGKVQEEERRVLVEAAERVGLERGTDAWHLFDVWLVHAPGEDLYQTWKDYVAVLRRSCSEDSMAALRAEIVGRARAVARASGGILGVGSVYGTEKDLLTEISEALGGE